MPRIPRSFTRRARSTASIFLGTPSGSACACISIAPLRVCAFADSEKTRNIAASRDLMDGPFIEQVSLELGVDLTGVCMVRLCVARGFRRYVGFAVLQTRGHLATHVCSITGTR